MSGGYWEYIQYRFTDVADDVDKLIKQNGVEKSNEEKKYGHYDLEWYEKYPEDKYHTKYSDEIIEKFKEARETIAKAQIYMQRLDWLLSGDDGEESFLSRLSDDLTNMKKYE